MNRVIPNYTILENNKDFPSWSVRIEDGDFTGIEYIIDKLGIPEDAVSYTHLTLPTSG